MNYLETNRKQNQFYEERLSLVMERLQEIVDEPQVGGAFDDYFTATAQLMLKLNEIVRATSENPDAACSEQGREWNRFLFAQALEGDNYENGFLNPAYACEKLGAEYGAMFAAHFARLRSAIAYAYEGNYERVCLLAELLVEIYVMMLDDDITAEKVQAVISSHVHDNQELALQYGIARMFDKNRDFYRTILLQADLNNENYLYKYGFNISDNERKILAFLQKMPQEELQAMADTYTEGFRLGFVTLNKPLEKKTLVEMRYPVGFEPMMRLAAANFEKMGLYVIAAPSSTAANKQYLNDHEQDEALWLDKSLVERRAEFLKKILEEYKEIAPQFAGPAVVETFGEKPFEPVNRKERLQFDQKQQGLSVQSASEQAQLINQYIHGEERSFTIIAYPIPEIGDQFNEIFAETVRVNTLDYMKYQQMQQKIIDVLDAADYVHVIGSGDNKTDIKVKIWDLENPEKETAFENCVADVNIPVGEVFTSPVLEGTNGKLHVTQVYLEGRNYLNLEIDFKDGMIADYHCTNFEDEQENRRYIEDNILKHHKSLPIGEFAIGTNTTAYRMGIQYGIQDKLPILIAEKTGPHFAVGDTCYTYDEDNETFNPDGKLIVARDNSVSCLRKTDISKAYFNCHTDITIPYNEIKSIIAVAKDKSEQPIILDGKFVVPGTEELNVPLEGLL